MAEDDGETRTNEAGREMNQEGRYKQKMTADEVYDVFDTVRGPVITAGDVADAFDTSTETARRRLRELYNDDRVEQRETRKRVLWWRTGDGDAVDLLMGNDPETLLKMVSREIDDAITVGDTVYENGDTHSVEQTDAS
jgi:predicted ArsR family transcriptional regulator